MSFHDHFDDVSGRRDLSGSSAFTSAMPSSSCPLSRERQTFSNYHARDVNRWQKRYARTFRFFLRVTAYPTTNNVNSVPAEPCWNRQLHPVASEKHWKTLCKCLTVRRSFCKPMLTPRCLKLQREMQGVLPKTERQLRYQGTVYLLDCERASC